MNSKERFLAVFDSYKRKKLDRVPTFVQYIREEFVKLHRPQFRNVEVPFPSTISRFKDAYIMGFESVFGHVLPGLRVSQVELEDENGEKVLVAWNGQPPIKKLGYYERGLFFSLENLNNVKETMRKVDDSEQILQLMNYYEKISPHIFPVIAFGGIFDTLWQSMGFNNFAYHYQKNSKLYQEIIKYFAELTHIRIQSFIDATGNQAGIVNINDDIAFKGRPMISPQRWEQDIGKYYKEICSLIRDAGMKTSLHSDGDVTMMIPVLKKVGFSGLQGWEGGADPRIINEKYPDFIVNGFGDISQIIPYGSKEDIFNHVKDLMDALKENRHFILGPSTVIYEGIPFENVKYFIEASYRYGKY
ncbi:MAG: uroporphyrinogen decarboxylase family protein [Promethearchaeota archaeon]|jgi:hypothetical protein